MMRKQSEPASSYHVPVMVAETLELLAPMPGSIIIDGTLGGGGHSAEILPRIGPTGALLGIDIDPEALKAASERFNALDLAGRHSVVKLFQARFDDLESVLLEAGIAAVDGVLLDLGASSHQLDDPGRGFSFKDPEAPLDMRMNGEGDDPTAADLLNEMTLEELTKTLRDFSDERWSARIASFIVERRKVRPFRTAGDLIETIKAAVPAGARSKDIHPATRTMQALRIAVNRELERLQRVLGLAVSKLKPGGRLVVISYHSGEDRIVKQSMALLSGRCQCPPELPRCICGAGSPQLRVLTKRPLTPSPEEVARNPRSWSAKLRAGERLEG